MKRDMGIRPSMSPNPNRRQSKPSATSSHAFLLSLQASPIPVISTEQCAESIDAFPLIQIDKVDTPTRSENLNAVYALAGIQ